MLWVHVPRYLDRTRSTRVEIKESNTTVLARPEVEMALMIGDHYNLTICSPPS